MKSAPDCKKKHGQPARTSSAHSKPLKLRKGKVGGPHNK